MRAPIHSPRPAAGTRRVLALAIATVLAAPGLPAFANTYTVTTTANSGAGSLRQAILDANATGAYAGIVSGSNVINVTTTGTITLSDALPMIFSNLTINGNGVTINGGDAHRCFFVSGLPTTPDGAPQVISVELNDLQLDHCHAKGGDGGSGGGGGGGGMGAGGAVFVNNNAALVLSKVTFANDSAAGGNGGGSASNAFGGGGGLGGAGRLAGGGFGGAGGQSYVSGGGGIGGNGGEGGNTGGGGGGGFGGSGIGQISDSQGFGSASPGYQGVPGGANGGGGGGGGVGATIGLAGDQAGTGGNGGPTGPGGAGGFNGGIGGGSGGYGNAGGFGGGGGAGGPAGNQNGRTGGFGGGGGGGFYAGNAGFGGGGGGAKVQYDTQGGYGGFGGGGGGGFDPGRSTFGGGSGGAVEGYYGTASGGGGGAALGGAIFAVQGSNVTISGSGSLADGLLTAGNGGESGSSSGGNGSTFGTGIFLHGSGTLSFDLGASMLFTISDDIADVQGSGGGSGSGSWGLSLASGTLVLTGANTYTGTTTVSGGTLELDGSSMSTTAVGAYGTLAGIGSVANAVNSGILAPGNGTTHVCTPQSNFQFTAGNFTQGPGAMLDILADPCGGNTQLVVTGAAGLGGTLRLDFQGVGPVPGQTFTVLSADSINGTFDKVESSMPKIFGQIAYSAHSVAYRVVANDGIFRDGFGDIDVAIAGQCGAGSITQQQFEDLPPLLFGNVPICMAPFSINFTGETATACQSSTCNAAPGCPVTLHVGEATLGGTLASGAYSLSAPATADTITAPVVFSGAILNANCTATLSNNAFSAAFDYTVQPDPFGGAYISALTGTAIDNLAFDLTSPDCPQYASIFAAAKPYIIPAMEGQMTNAFNSILPKPDGPGVGVTICPAP